jgi:hypothetical protein
MKVSKLITIDDDLIKIAEERKLNFSGTVNELLRNKLLDIIEVKPKEIEHCEFCGREEKRATREDLNGLTWLWPDERWICSTCLKRESLKLL